jgi:hypothetical protein
MNSAELGKTLRKQREALVVEPIHATLQPVLAYAKQIAEIKGEPFCVVSIPAGSTAHKMGYRYVSIPQAELEHYTSNGAQKVEQVAA